MHIGFVGIGRMGAGMARNLLRAGHWVTLFNRTPGKAEALVADGARIAASAAEASRDADAVITMLSDDPAVDAVVMGPDGIAAALPKGAFHVSCSTISTQFARRLAAFHAERGHEFLSAPVFGRPEAAEQKKLIVVAAGSQVAIGRCRPLLESIGRQTVVAGSEPWQANAVKLCGNFMIASMMEAFGEAFTTLRKADVDPQVFLECMNGLFASPVYANYGALIAERRFEPAGFPLRLGLKDMRLALQTAEECVSPMPLASLLRDRMLSGMAAGQGEMDWSSLTTVSARNAGL